MAARQSGAGLCVGVSFYQDKQLGVLPAAASSARDVEKALVGLLSKGVRLLADPQRSDDVFVAMQRAMRDARGGTLVLYYAGHALRRGGDLLLATAESEVEPKKGCVPWSDIEDLLARERVAQALVILNLDQPEDEPIAIEKPGVCVMGSVRVYERASANTRVRAYGEALLEPLRRAASDLAPYLTDGKLDVAGLSRYLSERAPAVLRHRLFSTSAELDLVLRDLSAELEAAKAPAAASAPPEAAPPEAPEEAAAPEAPEEAAPPEAPEEAEAPEEQAPEPEEKKALAPPRDEPSAELVKSPEARPSRVPVVLLVAAVVLALVYWFLSSR